jgi:hypothetical protein
METSRVRRGGVVGPVILIGAGVVFLLTNLGMIGWNVWDALFRLWPVLLIAVGLDILIGRRSLLGSLLVVALLLLVLAFAITSTGPITTAGQALTSEQISQPLEGATQGDVVISSGIADLRISAADEDSGLVEGQVSLNQGENIRQDRSKSGNTMYYTLRNEGTPVAWWPGRIGHDGSGVWDLKLSRDVPLTLKVDNGVGRTQVDLLQLRVTNLSMSGGVGQSTITLPRQGQMTASIDAGIGEIIVIVPAGMSARIRVDNGLSQTRVQGDFQHNGDEYVSPGYDNATNRVDLRVHGGIGSVTVQGTSGG